MTPDQYCREQFAQAGSTVHYSLLFLPPPRRRATTALFALCRLLDDAVERSTDPSVAHSRLAWWMQEIERLFAGTPQHPVARALAPHVRTYDLSLERFSPPLQARHLRLASVRFDDFEAMKRHCYAEWGVFGEMAAQMAGSSQAAARAFGGQLAVAARIIRLMRDAGPHVRAGRSVFAENDLAGFGLNADDLARPENATGFESLMALQARRVRQILASAVAPVAPADRPARQAAVIMGALYEALLDELERSRFQVMHQRIALTPLRKLLIACRIRAIGPSRGSALT